MNERQKHKLADTAQQTVGGFLLSGPFVVTQEVRNATVFHSLFLVGAIMAIGYGGLYGADNERNPRREAVFAGVPVRFISVIIVAFGFVAMLAFSVTAPTVSLRWSASTLSTPSTELRASSTACSQPSHVPVTESVFRVIGNSRGTS